MPDSKALWVMPAGATVVPGARVRGTSRRLCVAAAAPRIARGLLVGRELASVEARP